MNTEAYNAHFEEYGCHFYKISEDDEATFTQADAHWLKNVGLPDNPIPIFFFDFYLQHLREINIPGSKYVIGTAFSPTSKHYIFVDLEDRVYMQTEKNERFLVNASIAQLSSSIYAYSNWLEAQEDAFIDNIDHEVTDLEIFEIYCQLRHIDKEAMYKGGVWFMLMHAKIQFMSEETPSQQEH